MYAAQRLQYCGSWLAAKTGCSGSSSGLTRRRAGVATAGICLDHSKTVRAQEARNKQPSLCLAEGTKFSGLKPLRNRETWCLPAFVTSSNPR